MSDTAAVASARGYTAKTAEAIEGSAPKTVTARWKEYPLLTQLIVPSHPPPI